MAALDAKAETKPQNTTGQVSQLFSRMAPAVLDIAIGSDKITVTPEHEFWVIGEGWKEAKELWVGAKLLTKESKEVRVEWIGKRFGEFRVYNFSVAGSATYFVGKTGVLVHNRCPELPVEKLLKINFLTLRKTILARAIQKSAREGMYRQMGCGKLDLVNTKRRIPRTCMLILSLTINPTSKVEY